MKIESELIRYQYKQYMLSSKWLMPLVVFMIILVFMYDIGPLDIVNSFSLMGLFLFGIMVWIGVTIQNVEPEVSEQIMILRLKSERRYYVYHIIFVTCISAVLTTLAVIFPIIKNSICRNSLLSRSVIWSDIVGGFLLMFVCAFVGGMVGELFHYRIIRKRYIGIGLTFFVALIAICRNGVIAKYTVTKYILWVIPPVSDVVSWFSYWEYFDMGKLLGGFVLLLMYGIVIAVVKVELLRKKGF